MGPEDYRDQLLPAAVAAVEKWCCPPDQMVEQRKRPDTFWMMLFGGLGQRAVTPDEAHLFLVTFMLTNRVLWDRQMVADIIMRVQNSEGFNPVQDVPAVARELRDANARNTRQTSAASKISTFVKPEAQVFIWDALASKSARFRDWHRTARTGRGRFNALYMDGESHDYPAFYAACERARDDERQRDDFVEARDGLIDRFRHGPGPMADPTLVTDEFIERRLLDKLMFAEGWVLDRQLPPPADWLNGTGM